jgi:hypothetical protein
MRVALLVVMMMGALGCTTSMGSGENGGTSGGPTEDPNGPPAQSLSANIDRVGLDMDGTMAVQPILLLKGGVACKCLDEDLDTVTIEDVRKRRPKDVAKDVGQWRPGTKKAEVNWGTKWKELYFNVNGLQLGDGWTSSKSYERTTTIGAAGTDSFAGASKRIAFDPSGRFEFAGGTTTSSSASTSRSKGTYSVSGWMMTLKFADGKEWRVSAVTGGDEPGRTLWLSGAGYAQ